MMERKAQEDTVGGFKMLDCEGVVDRVAYLVGGVRRPLESRAKEFFIKSMTLGKSTVKIRFLFLKK